MSKATFTGAQSFEFTLPDAGSGGETRSASGLATERDYVLVVLLRSHYCPFSRRIVKELADEYDAFAGRSTAVVPVLSDRRERARVWQRRYDLPFGLLTDPTDESADGATCFDAFEPFADILDRLPGAVLFDAGEDDLRFVRTVGADALAADPVADPLLTAIDDHREDGVEPVEPCVDPGMLGGS